jgi:hypothetical protein
MDWKTVVIGVLVASAVLMGGLVASGLRADGAAYGQRSVYDTYLVTTANVQDNYVHFVVLDTQSRRMLFYRVDTATYQLEPVTGRDLSRDFPRVP